MASFAQLMFNGLALGAAYALVALGFVLVVNATGAVNFAHGGLVMAGGYTAVVLAAWLQLPLLVLLPLVGAVTFILGVAICIVAYFPLLRRPPSTVFVSTLLCGIILENTYIVVFGPQARPGRSSSAPFSSGSSLWRRASLLRSWSACNTWSSFAASSAGDCGQCLRGGASSRG